MIVSSNQQLTAIFRELATMEPQDIFAIACAGIILADRLNGVQLPADVQEHLFVYALNCTEVTSNY